MIETQIQLNDEQIQALKELAAKQGVSLAALIQQAVDQMLESAGPVDWEERKRRALAAAGRFRSGQPDLSDQHDDHLAQAYGA